MCARLGMASLGHIALDGTKVKADASRRGTMSYGRMKQEERRMRNSVKMTVTGSLRT